VRTISKRKGNGRIQRKMEETMKENVSEAVLRTYEEEMKE
jgi:hypothetical protein